MQTENTTKIEHPSVPLDLSAFLQEERKSAYRYLYIGQDQELMQLLNDSFSEGTTAATYSEAQQLLHRSLQQKEVIDVIFFDLLIQEGEFNKVCQVIKKYKAGADIAVIFNQERLTSKKINISRQLHLIEANGVIDDVVDLKKNRSLLEDKIAFLKQASRRTINISLLRQLFKKYTNPAHVPISGKRIFDIVVSAIALLLLSPVLLLIALAVKLESKGPVFYISLRAGKGYKVFKFYKFRSMVTDADQKVKDLIHLNQYNEAAEGPRFFKINNDPRVTRLGRFLRKTSLDELPQLLNVLKGDMSLVGNRPLPLYEAETLTTNEFVERFVAPAGITGLWQVMKRGKEEMSTEERISLDIRYARKNNLIYDFKILAITPAALFQKSNA